jgi:TolB-like protein/Flp pilus assembly protein TadD
MTPPRPSADQKRHSGTLGGRTPGAAQLNPPSEQLIQAQLEKILASKGFVNSERMRRFLRFAVEQALKGQPIGLKESLIGVAVFDRRPSYQPQLDPIVRVEARRLRSKLEAYYDAEGKQDAVRISLPTPGYIPTFRYQDEGASTDSQAPLRILARRQVVAWLGVLCLAVLAVYSTGVRWTPDNKSRKVPPSIAVLPFSNLGFDQDSEYFADGMTEELINALMGVQGLAVVARTSVFQFKGKSYDIRQLGKKLNAQTVLEGSVRKTAGRLRVTAQLINVSNGHQLWSQVYDREPKEIFATQEEICQAIIKALRIQIGTPQDKPVKHTSLESHNLYLKGRYFSKKRTDDGNKKAIEFFMQAIALDPDDSLALAGLSDCYMLLGYSGAVPQADAVSKARSTVTKALQIDDTLAEAHTTLGLLLATYDWDWSGAEREFKRAIELSPHDPTAHHWYAHKLLAPMGRLDEALAEIKQAEQLDPLSLIVNTVHADILLLRGDYDQSIEQCRRTIELDPNFLRVYWSLGAAYQQKGMHPQALAAFQKAAASTGGNPYTLGSLGLSYTQTGKFNEARKLLTSLANRANPEPSTEYSMALVHLGLGEREQALDLLGRAVRERRGPVIYLKVDPRFDGLRSDSKFQALLKRIGLTWP